MAFYEEIVVNAARSPWTLVDASADAVADAVADADAVAVADGGGRPAMNHATRESCPGCEMW